MSYELDLHGTIRPGLDILANEIIISLKKRTRFRQNLVIYEPGLVIGHPDISLLLYELNRMEQFHAELGRYIYATQEPFTEIGDTQLIIKREAPPSPIRNFPTNAGGNILAVYVDWIKQACPEGDDSNSYGETVTADVYALLNIFERINLGKSVAEYKFENSHRECMASQGDPELLRAIIVNPEREQKVLEVARGLARHYDFDEEQACRIFSWMIAETTRVEIEYIQKRIAGL